MRAPKNIDTGDLRTSILRTRCEVIERIQYLNAQIDYNDLNGHADCKENRQMLREMRQLRRYNRWLARLLKEVW